MTPTDIARLIKIRVNKNEGASFYKNPSLTVQSLVRNGRAGEIIERIIEELRPGSIYFAEHNGTRGAVALFEVENYSRIYYFVEHFI